LVEYIFCLIQGFLFLDRERAKSLVVYFIEDAIDLRAQWLGAAAGIRWPLGYFGGPEPSWSG
jgi:hypothetical protein